ncbi:conserved hypothetical protein [Tenacibaculum litopenaei]|uniref:Crp/Fnr family transcriptional regulator n=1 Tax=Tenacibaculum litopenaei TaxID=396016 RepID=UPI0038960F39
MTSITALLLDNPDFSSDLYDIAQVQSHPKNSTIHEAGHRCNHLYLVNTGLIRVFYLKEGKDITVHLAKEQESFTAIDSLFQNKKSTYSIETLEPSELIRISAEALEQLLSSKPHYERIGRLFTQNIYIELATRLHHLQLHTARERYQILTQKHPDLLRRVPAKHLASYLGMTAETFSRIRY